MKQHFQKFVLLLWLVLSTAHYLLAQHGKPIQLEFPSEKYSTQQQCIRCQKDGVCILYPSYTNDSLFVNIQHYDLNLNMVHHASISINAQYTYIGATYQSGEVLILYQNKPKKKREPDGCLIRYTLNQQRIDTLSIHNLPTDDIYSIASLHDHILFLSATKRDNAKLFFLNRQTAYARPLFLPDLPDHTVNDYLIDSINQKVIICIDHAGSSKNNAIWCCESTLSGEITQLVQLPNIGDIRFQNAHIAQIDPTRYLVVGTYQTRKGNIDNSANGTYSTIYENGQFSDPSLNAYLPVNVPVSSRTYESNVHYLPGKILHKGTHFAFISEAYYPEYKYSTTYTYGIPTTEPIFVGYRFVNAEIMVFDTLARKTWEYSFPFDNMLVTNLTSHLRMSISENNILFYFLSGQNLITMLIDKEMKIIDPIRSTQLFSEENKTQQTIYTLALNPWYDNYYLLLGYRFKKTGNVKNTNPVYFIHKLKYQ